MIACICGGTLEVFTLLGLMGMIGWLCKKIKSKCCCKCHKEHGEG